MKVKDQNKSATKSVRKWPVSAKTRFMVAIVLLLVVIIAMLLAWKPWNSKRGDRTVSVVGETTLRAEPDEYVFTPTYQYRVRDNARALDAATKKSEAIVKALKMMGVTENKIKSNINGYEEYAEGGKQNTVYTLSLSVTVNDRSLAQKVQNYIVQTSPSGNVSPQASFSDARRKALEQQARDEAIKDATAKAEQNARNLGFKVGDVKDVSDGSGFGVIAFEGGYDQPVDAYGKTVGLLPGENELNYSVHVTFFVK